MRPRHKNEKTQNLLAYDVGDVRRTSAIFEPSREGATQNQGLLQQIGGTPASAAKPQNRTASA